MTFVLMVLTYLLGCPGLLGLFLAMMFLYAVIPQRYSNLRLCAPLCAYPCLALALYGPRVGPSALSGLAATIAVLWLPLCVLLAQSEAGLRRQAQDREKKKDDAFSRF